MAVSLFAAEEGYLDSIDLNKVAEFEDGLLCFVRANAQELLNEINMVGDYNDVIKAKLKSAVDAYSSSL
jgi:F-type H+-transporting ATPase subunit alpha